MWPRMLSVFIILLSSTPAFLQDLVEDDRKPLIIATMFPMSGGWAGGIGCAPAVKMALADVNNDKNLLTDYKLILVEVDSKCLPGLSLKYLYDLLYDNQTKLVLMTGCSGVSTFVAQAAHMYNLIVLSYGSSSPALSDRKRFPTFFRTHPSATLHNPTRLKLFKKFKWKRIATIQQTEEVFTSTIKDLEKVIKESDSEIEIAVRQSFQTDPSNAVKSLRRQDARIIVGVFYEDMARRVFCEVAKEEMFGPRYVWLIIGWYPDGWYEKPDPNIDCTAEQMRKAVEGHFTTEVVQYNLNEKKITDTGISTDAFKRRLKERLPESVQMNTTSLTQVAGYVEAPLAYDAVWALSFALDKTIEDLENRRLEDFNYNDSTIKDAIFARLNKTDFEGVSGRVTFTSTGDRIAKTQIEQMQSGEYKKVGYYNQLNDRLDWLEKDIWPEGGPPSDRTLIEDKLLRISTSLSYTMFGLAALGVIFSLVALIFNFSSRQYSMISNSQPVMNCLIVFGCLMCLSCVPLFGIDGLEDRHQIQLCEARTWLISFGFTISFGSMFVKIFYSWRIIKSSKNKNSNIPSTKVIDDTKLDVPLWEPYCILSSLLVLDAILLGAWRGIDPLSLRLEEFALEDPGIGEDIKYKPLLKHCSCDYQSVWLGIIYGYKGCLLLAGLFLAYETRSVKIRSINDLRFVAMAVYNVVVLCLIAVPVTLIIPNQQNARFTFIAVAIILSCYLTVGLLFIPKMVTIATRRMDMDEEETQQSLMHHETEKRYNELKSLNDQLKQEISKKETRIHELHAVLQKKFTNVLSDDCKRSDSAFSEEHSNNDRVAENSEASTSSANQTAPAEPTDTSDLNHLTTKI